MFRLEEKEKNKKELQERITMPNFQPVKVKKKRADFILTMTLVSEEMRALGIRVHQEGALGRQLGIKSTSCSCGGPGINFQHPHGGGS